MRGFGKPLFLFGACVAVACGDDGESRPPSLVPAGQGGNAAAGAGGGGSAARAGSGNSGENAVGGAKAEAGASSFGGTDAEAGTAGEGGRAGDGAGGTDPDPAAGAGGEPWSKPPRVITACSKTFTLGGARRLPLSTGADDRLAGVTPGEHTLAWITEEVGGITLHSAQSEGGGADFAALRTHALVDASSHATLHDDGLQVVFVNSSGKGFSSVSRSSLDDAFGAEVPYEAAPLGPDGSIPAGESYGEPVLAAGGLALYYSRFGGQSTDTVFAASRMNAFGPWSPGAPLPIPDGFAATPSNRLTPAGASADGYTIFLRDAANSRLLAAFIDPISAELTDVIALGDLVAATPNRACDRLYYSQYSAASGSIDLFVAPVMP